MPRKKKPRICCNCVYGQTKPLGSTFLDKMYGEEDPDLRICTIKNLAGMTEKTDTIVIVPADHYCKHFQRGGRGI